MTVLIAIIFAVVVIGSGVIYQYYHSHESVKVREFVPMDQKNILIPEGYLFDTTHTWVFRGADGNCKVGLDDFLQHVVGKISRIEIIKNEGVIKKGEALARIYQDDRFIQIYSPMSGEIIQENTQGVKKASVINIDPYHNGWLIKVQPLNYAAELPLLMVAEKAKLWMKDEWVRLKDFFAFSAQKYELAPAMIAMQDGGEIQDKALENSKNEIWQEFQVEFIDAAKQE